MNTFTTLVFILILCFLTISTCTKSSNSIGGRVVGGEVAYAGQFPFLAAINVNTATSTFFCAGALLNQNWIITAAHCVEEAVSFTIRLGSNTLEANDPNRLVLATSHYEIHPNYNPLSLENNIGLIELRLPVSYGSYIQPIALSERDVPDYNHLTAVGWGQTSDANPNLSNDLQYVSLISISNTECQNVYGFQVSPDMVCLTGNYNEGTCIGDSGGPLIEHIYVPQGVRLAGVASFLSGNGCESTDPSGYTRSYLARDWILNVTNSN